MPGKHAVPEGIAVDLLFAARPFSGLEHHALHILRGLHQVGASVDVLVPSDVIPDIQDAVQGHRVVPFPRVPRGLRLGREQWSFPWRFGAYPRALRLLHSVLGVAPLLSGVPLVLVGRTNRGAERLARQVRQAGPRSHVIALDYVPREILPAIYSGASLFCYPSRYEGFGLPVLEAMSCATPVIVSSADALVELVDEAGVVLRTESVEELTQAMERLLRFDNEQARLRNAGLQRSRAFSVERLGRETAEVYRQAFAA